jgi:hypothetical protein
LRLQVAPANPPALPALRSRKKSADRCSACQSGLKSHPLGVFHDQHYISQLTDSLGPMPNRRQQFEKPMEMSPGTSIFVSLLIDRQSPTIREDSSVQIVLEPESDSPRYTRLHSLSFGVSSDGRPFVNNAGVIEQTAMSVMADVPLLLVFKYESQDRDFAAGSLRIYRQGDLVDSVEPSVWTVHGGPATGTMRFASLRISVGAESEAQVDELRIGTSWNSVVNTPGPAP